MKLTGKCKIDFEKWYNDNYNITETDEYNFVPIKGRRDGEWNSHTEVTFNMLTNAMKFGVMVDYFESVGYDIEIYRESSYSKDYKINGTRYDVKEWNEKTSRYEARLKVIEKANAQYNSKTT